MQHAAHALLGHKELIWLQLERYTHGANKCDALVRVRPGDSVAVPFFTETLRHESFTVAALVYHLGETALSGHYMTLIGKPNGANWEYYVCDDNRQPRRGEVAASRSQCVPGWTCARAVVPPQGPCRRARLTQCSCRIGAGNI